MSVSPVDDCTDPQTIADNLRERLLTEGWPAEKITTDITIWADGDFRVKVWHAFDHDSTDTKIRVQYTRYTDGSIERRRLKLETHEQWAVLEKQSIT